MKMGLYHQHKKCERARKCHRFPVFWVSYKLDGLTGLAGITVLQNPRILQTAGGNPLDIRARQEVWNIVFLDCLLPRCAPRNTPVVAQVYSGVTFLSSFCRWRHYGGRVLIGRVWRKIFPSLMQTDIFRDACSYSFIFLPNHISPEPYAEAHVKLQAQIMSKLSFSQQETHHTLIPEGGAGRKAQCSHRVGMAPESGTFRCAQSCSYWFGAGKEVPVWPLPCSLTAVLEQLIISLRTAELLLSLP